MTKERVLAHIDELAREIQELDECDEPTKARLAGLAEEIKESVEGGDAASDWSDIAATVKSHVEQFEIEHPVLTGTLDRIMDALKNMGI